MSAKRLVGAGLLVGLVVLAGCATEGDPDDAVESAQAPEDAEGKEWMVDTSGWWVPDDPTGCQKETTTCQQEAWPVREFYSGGATPAVFTHGDMILLECRAPTPVAIRSATEVESGFWYYSSFGEDHWWVPDVYVTKDVTEMAQGVDDCSSDTPGIDGRGS